MRIGLENLLKTSAQVQIPLWIGNFNTVLTQNDGKIYSLEAGNDGNQVIERMIDANAFGLGDFRLVESSEAAMLVQVGRAVRNKEWVIFLDEGEKPEQAAKSWLKANPEVLYNWLAGVTAFDGGDAVAAIRSHLGF